MTMIRLTVLLLLVCVTSPSLQGQPSAETMVLKKVQEMMRSSGGRVTFSDLINDQSFAERERQFLARLYETFFQIPGFLKSEFESTGKVPTRGELASGFGISMASVELLLRVMEADRRVPPLFDRDAETREISSLKLDNIEAFIASRGDQVKLAGWEGQTLPAFELESFDGSKFSSEMLRGHNSLVYFWFTGCPPCVRIAPLLSRLDAEYRPRGFRIVGLNADRVLEIDVSAEQREEYLKKHGTEYPNLHLDEKTRKAFGNVNVYPTLFFVDPSLTIRRHLLNFQDMETLESIVEEMRVSP